MQAIGGMRLIDDGDEGDDDEVNEWCKLTKRQNGAERDDGGHDQNVDDPKNVGPTRCRLCCPGWRRCAQQLRDRCTVGFKRQGPWYMVSQTRGGTVERSWRRRGTAPRHASER